MRRHLVFTLLSLLVGASSVDSFGASEEFRQRRATHWAWQPVRPQTPPQVAQADWASDPIDRFILAKLRENGLEPAPPAEKRVLIRRLSFALTGLPPSPEEVDAFVKDDSAGAYERVVDRLLASPRFGERWARHWMDLVRYADTLGNESDAMVPNAWRYRDYVIRAFNADVPYDQFVREHLAGDLLEHPRSHPKEGFNESVIATAFFWMNEGKRSPVDVKQAQADCFDNKIDVMCKTFLGLTVGCARCHDHKFDAITQADYYALYGYLKGARYTQAMLNAAAFDAPAQQLLERKERLREPAGETFLAQSKDLSRYLLASTRAATKPVEAVAAAEGLSPERLKLWVKALHEPAKEDHPMFAWARLADLGSDASVEAFDARRREISNQLRKHSDEATASRHREGDIELSDYVASGYSGWFAEDQAFGTTPLMPGDFLMGDTATRPISAFVNGGAWAHSAAVSRRLQGTLRSPTFTIDRRYLHVLVAGRGARINVNVEHFVMIQDPLYGGLRYVPNDDTPHWHTFDLGMWTGNRAYIEFADTTTPDLHDYAPKGCDPEGYLAVGRVLLSDQGAPALLNQPPDLLILNDTAPESLQAVAERYQSVVRESLRVFQSGELARRPDADARSALLNWMIQHGLLDRDDSAPDTKASQRVDGTLAEFHQIETTLPEPLRAPATVDGNAEDEHVFIRGNHKTPGPIAPRRMLAAIAGDAQSSAGGSGSGRLELARRFSDPANPFVSRVMVNRVWYHLLGRGIVASVDNFGALGDKPTHPELLDYLASGFVEDGWSVKRLIRRIVLSNTFRMSSHVERRSDEIDPENKWFHRAMVRRLEGEAIRDEMLAVSGRLDAKMFGPGVEVFLTPFLLGNYVADYGRPAASGPLDGDGRRSVYMLVRRNFLPPMMVAFDAPPPINTAGRRMTSNVPSQALILMNDPFVIQQAQLWAQRVLADKESDAAARIRRMYAQAYSRPPMDSELSVALKFLDGHGEELRIPQEQRAKDPKLWSDLAHVMMNVKEFIFLQ